LAGGRESWAKGTEVVNIGERCSVHVLKRTLLQTSEWRQSHVMRDTWRRDQDYTITGKLC
jgi:hypothetical protein